MRIAAPTAALFLLVSPLALGAQVYPDYQEAQLLIDNYSQYKLWIWTESPDGRRRLAVEQIEAGGRVRDPSRLILDEITRVCVEAWVEDSRTICWDIYANRDGGTHLIEVTDEDFLGIRFGPELGTPARPYPETLPESEEARWREHCGRGPNYYRGLLRVIPVPDSYPGFTECFEESCQAARKYFRGAEDVPAGYWTGWGKTWYVWKEVRFNTRDRWYECDP
jgi:hypothetical protein